MGFSASDVVPFTQARANLSELADQAKACVEKIITKNGESYVALIDADRLDYYHRLERERIHLLLIDDAKRGLTDIAAGRTSRQTVLSACCKSAALSPPRHPTSSRPRSVADPLLYRVELTASFLERLDVIKAILVEADAAFAFDDLLAELRATVIPNLQRFPRIGRRYLANPPQSAEALVQLAALPTGAPDALREYMHGDYLMLYTVVDASSKAGSVLYLLSIRNHRELSFDFARLWPVG